MTALLTDTDITSRFQIEVKHPVFAKRLLEDLYRRYPGDICSVDMRTKFLLAIKNHLITAEGDSLSFTVYKQYLWLIFLIQGLPTLEVDIAKYQQKIDDSWHVIGSARDAGQRFLLTDLLSEIAVSLNNLNHIRQST